MRTRHHVLIAVLLCLFAWALYAGALSGGFVHYDDVRILRDHPELYDHASLADACKAIFITYFPREEPLLFRDLTWACDSLVFGFGNAWGYHLGNLFLHGVVVALMYLFLVTTTGRLRLALCTTILFSVLAIHVEPVVWIMGRKDLLSALFMLLALYSQTRRLDAARLAGTMAWYGLTVACVLAGLLSKISVLTFPAVLLLHAALLPHLRHEQAATAPWPWKRLLTRELPLALPIMGLSLAVFVWYRGILNAFGLLDRGYSARGGDHLWNLALVNPMAWWLYLKQTLWPADLSLFYTWPSLEMSRSVFQILASLATVGGVLAVTLWLCIRRKDLLFYWLAFFVLLIPYMNLIYIGIWVADRYIYFAVFALLAMLVELSIGLAATRRARVILAVLAGIFVGGNLVQNVRYQRVWRDPDTLWQYHLMLPNPSIAAFETLAVYYYKTAIALDEPEARAPRFQKMAVVVDAGLNTFWPDRSGPPPAPTWQLFFLRAIVEEIRGRPEAAIESLLTSLSMNEAFAASHQNLAMLYRRQALMDTSPTQKAGDARKAVTHYRRYIMLTFGGGDVPESIRQLHRDLSNLVPEGMPEDTSSSVIESTPL